MHSRAASAPAPDSGATGFPDATPRSASLKDAAWIFALNRALLLTLGWLTSRLFYDVLGSDRSLLGIWERWDVRWYVTVADHGYVWHAPPQQSDLAFFPLYPLAMHLLALLTPLSAYAAGLVVSSLSFAACLYLLHRLAALDYGADVAARAVFFLGIFPTSLFTFTAYSEALFLLCSVGCLYALRLERWWVAGLCGLAAALTRQLGLLLVVPYAVELWERRRLVREQGTGWVAPLGGLALIPAGLLLFVGYLQARLGDGLLFLRAQSAWGRSLAWPWQGVTLDLQHLVHMPGSFSVRTSTSLQTITVLDLAFLAFFVGLVVVGARLLPRSYTIYAAIIWLVIALTPAQGDQQPLALLSIPRFGLVIFPGFIALALLSRRPATERALTGIFVLLLTLFTIIFVRGRWIA